MTDENGSGSPEDASYALEKRASERRRAIDRFREKLEQHAELRLELEKAYSADGKGAPAASSPKTRGHFAAAFEPWNGRNSATEDLNKAAAAALKVALTPKQANALRDLETGKNSTLATAKIFQSTPHLLEMFPGTSLIRKVRELVQMLNAPEEWNGYLDEYWTTGQTVLWIVTGDPWAVDQASNDSGRLGETWGQLKAATLIDTLNLRREQVQDAADELRRRCLDGRMIAIDGQNRPIPAIEWRHLKIVLDDGNMPSVQRVGQSTIVPAYRHAP